MSCHLSIANDANQFFRQFTESQLNPFRIFGTQTISAILLDLVYATRKTLEALKELRERFSTLPPVIGLCKPSLVGHSGQFLESGVEKLVAFPDQERALRVQLRNFLEKSQNDQALQKQIFQPVPPGNLHVVNLKTYELLKNLSHLQKFPLEQLFQSFLQEMEDLVIRLSKALEQGNVSDCERLIISVRSLSGTLGASQMAQVARQMELSLKNGKPDESGLWLPFLIEQFLVLREFFETAPESRANNALLT